MDLPVLAFCVVCTDPIRSYALGECNHRNLCSQCYVMGMKQYNRRDCVVCNKTFGAVVVTENGTKPFESYNFKALCSSPKFENTYFEGRAQLKTFENLYAIACPECGLRCNSKNDLVAHCHKDHNLLFCKVCLSKRKGVLLRQQRLYTAQQLRTHMNSGDPATDKEGPIPAHVACTLCNEKNLYDLDDRNLHMIERHICCQLCKRKNIEEWVANNKKLVAHYQSAHLTCDDPTCCAAPMENVFDNEISFQAHMLKVHGDKINSKELLRRTQRISISFQRKADSSCDIPSIPVPSSAGYQDISFDADPQEQNRVLMNEIRKLKGDTGFAAFRNISGEYFRGNMIAEDYYDQFCEMFKGCSTAGSIWMLLVSSLPNSDLRSELHRVHYESVQNGGGFNFGSGTGRATTGARSNTKKSKSKIKIDSATLRTEDKGTKRNLNTDAESEKSLLSQSDTEKDTNNATTIEKDLTGNINNLGISCNSEGTAGGNNPSISSKTGKKGRFKKKEVLYRL